LHNRTLLVQTHARGREQKEEEEVSAVVWVVGNTREGRRRGGVIKNRE
jgi:hypothetical protein